MSRINFIDLTSYEFNCAICDVYCIEPHSAEHHAVARYEDEVVPDGYTGDWGGASVCERCYWIERGLHAKDPAASIPFSTIRRISKP